MPRTFIARTGLAPAMLALSAGAFAGLLARYDVHWTVFLLWSSVTVVVVGAALAHGRGCLVGAAAGLVAGALLVLFYGFLWLTFTLPPHPPVDL